ncbi:50S ribosomal protein L16 [bacterium]|jgi:large subunit ribosomal protein L16|nr:50S ribosomal protein L16 [bacterium]MBT4649523.1 50S ribosomal protein L16 [bacterium]
MLAPKKVKHRKWHRGDKIKGKATRMTKLSFGDYGLKSLSTSWVTARQIESARRAITGHVQRGAEVFIRIFPDKPITAKGNEMPMGKGKGAVDHYVAVVKPGTIMFEMSGMDEVTSKKALKLAAYKLPVKTKIVTKELI